MPGQEVPNPQTLCKAPLHSSSWYGDQHWAGGEARGPARRSCAAVLLRSLRDTCSRQPHAPGTLPGAWQPQLPLLCTAHLPETALPLPLRPCPSDFLAVEAWETMPECNPLTALFIHHSPLQDFLTLKAYDILVSQEFGPTWGAKQAAAGGSPRSRM